MQTYDCNQRFVDACVKLLRNATHDAAKSAKPFKWDRKYSELFPEVRTDLKAVSWGAFSDANQEVYKKQTEAWRADYDEWLAENKYRGFNTDGHHNNDTLNSMLAWYAVNQAPWDFGEPIIDLPEFDVEGYKGWIHGLVEAADISADEKKWQITAIDDCIDRMLPYMYKYVCEPPYYSIDSYYLRWNDVKNDWVELRKQRDQWEIQHGSYGEPVKAYRKDAE